MDGRPPVLFGSPIRFTGGDDREPSSSEFRTESRSPAKYRSLGLSVPSIGRGVFAFQSVILSDTERDRPRLGTTLDASPVGFDDDISVLFAVIVIA